MAYVTGTANSFTELLAALQNACTTNGWTLSGNVLHKGTCYAEVTYNTASNPCLKVQCGTGIDGSNALTGRSDANAASLGMPASNGDATIPAGNVPFTFPVTYFIHVLTAPDEVYCIVNYGVSYYQHLEFGQSAMQGLAGTGNWYTGSKIFLPGYPINGMDLRSIGGAYFGGSFDGGMFMSLQGYAAQTAWCGVHHALDAGSPEWLVEGAWRDWGILIANTPSAWNQESVLLPIRIYASRPSGFVSPVLDCAHARYVNIAALGEQQIITLGADKWKIYPWWRRGNGLFNGAGLTYTGLHGHAIRYDGP